MTRSLVLTVIGPDRPGIVDLLSRTVNDAGGNWLESQMSRLAGQFAGILRVECEDEKVRRSARRSTRCPAFA
ncbi:MAG: ACT domain-containing protein [Polyangiales bacterium]